MSARTMAGDRYELQEILGQGANGTVYRATDMRLGKFVAVKILPRQDTEQIKREMQIQKELSHPMLPIILDVFETEKECCIVMEYVDGMTLDTYLEKNGAVEERQAVKIALQLLDVLQYLHTRRPPVIYQDLKPSNIMLCPDGTVRLIDFGTSVYRHYDGRKVAAAGTKGYASPEQLAGDGRWIGVQSDLYSFGAVLYSLLTGIRLQYPPYRMDSIRALFPHVSEQIAAVIDGCTAEALSERFKDVRDVREAILFGSDGHKADTGSALWQNFRKSFQRKKQKLPYTARIKSVFLSAKKHAGLWSLLLALGAMQMMSGTFHEMLLKRGLAAYSVLPVTVYNELGQKVLIQYGSVYDLQGDFLLEVPCESLRSDTASTLKITVCGPLGVPRRERVFKLHTVQ